ncbi:MAG TPA: holo-ACP synthase [Solirubrobacteraceae bacterium]|nr:holo-ACP synthase [Solirubrobacteraceae bacterium]
MPVRVGIDLVSVQGVRDALEGHGQRYLERVYTPAERQSCGGREGVDPQRLAARFAAKEATLKVLRPGSVGVPWREIEVNRAPEGWVSLALSGAAAGLARQAGITDLALSLSHEGDLALAVVVAEVPSREG